MTTIYLQNFEIEHCLIALKNIIGNKSNQSGANALTMYRLNKLTKDFMKEFEDYRELKRNLLDKHVEGGADTPKSEGGNYVFKDDESKDAFMDAMGKYSAVNLRCLLDEADLKQFSCSSYDIQWISKMIRGEAPTENPEKQEKDEQQTKK